MERSVLGLGISGAFLEKVYGIYKWDFPPEFAPFWPIGRRIILARMIGLVMFFAHRRGIGNSRANRGIRNCLLSIYCIPTAFLNLKFFPSLSMESAINGKPLCCECIRGTIGTTWVGSGSISDTHGREFCRKNMTYVDWESNSDTQTQSERQEH